MIFFWIGAAKACRQCLVQPGFLIGKTFRLAQTFAHDSGCCRSNK